MKYLDLGIFPVRFEIMKRKVIFLQYLLQQEKKSMIYQVFQATSENPIKNDFVNLCKKYLQILKIELSFTEIEYLSKYKFKKIVKEKVTTAAFDYLMREKLKQTKICDINYEKLEMEDYLLDGNKNTRTSKFIFKARSKTLDIKMQRGWKYKDKICRVVR